MRLFSKSDSPLGRDETPAALEAETTVRNQNNGAETPGISVEEAGRDGHNGDVGLQERAVPT